MKKQIKQIVETTCSTCDKELSAIFEIKGNGKKQISFPFCDNFICKRFVAETSSNEIKFIYCLAPMIFNLNCNCEHAQSEDENKPKTNEHVDHPKHYNNLPAECLDCGRPIECIDVIEHVREPNIAAAIKYLWRYEDKENPVRDLKKAIWYINRQIQKIERKDNE